MSVARYVAVPVVVSALASCSVDAGVSVVEIDEASDTDQGLDPSTDTGPGGDGGEGGNGATTALDWQPCDGDANPLVVVPLECATLRVPLDHDEPDGDLIELAVARLPAGEPDRRIGSLVFNPGGPGGSGIEFLRSAAFVVPDDVALRFDLVGFDPRGVGDSAAVDCDVDWDDQVSLLDEDDDAGWDALVVEAEQFPDTCPDEALQLAPHVGTNNAARDLDLLRAALGDERLSYVGFSYGTRLGATYAELFPDRVRALVLDGGVLPEDELAVLDREQAAGFDRALRSFATACDADDDCPLGELGATLDVLADVQAEIDEVGSFTTDDPDRVLTAGELRLGVAAALYSTQLWPFLAHGLELASTEADGTLLQVLADQLAGRNPDGSYSNQNEASFFVNCADDPTRPPVEIVREQAEEAAGATRYFADLVRANTGCIGAPDPIDPLVVGPAEGAWPILVVGTTGDPATPYEWSVALAASLDSAVLYTVEGEGHTAYLSVDCVEDVVGDYLVDLELPDAGEGCSDEAVADVFLPAGETDIERVVAFFECLADEGVDVDDVTLGDVLADPTGATLFGDLDLTDPGTIEGFQVCFSVLEL